ncbi:unnamed protein product [Meloidogyne enterolobii]|uniref:Uncharacterized protein n=1 Tax=Meloidogyne enterolobii TaxID=390850 RepID=A0ACB0Y2T4_MELEN
MDTTHLKSTEKDDNNDNNSISSLNEESSSSSISNKAEDDNKLLNKTDKTNGKNEKMVKNENEGNLREDKIDFQPNTTKRPTEMDNNLNASSPLLDRNQSQKSFKKYLNPSPLPTTTIIPTPTNSSINSSIDSSQHSDWRSLYICTFLTFCSAVQFSLYFSSMRQYLQIMDSSASENFYGYIVASYSLGQMIASPIVGYLSNRLKKIRHLLYIGIFLAFLGNALYLCVHLFPIEERKYALLIGRFVTGIGSTSNNVSSSVFNLCWLHYLMAREATKKELPPVILLTMDLSFSGSTANRLPVKAFTMRDGAFCPLNVEMDAFLGEAVALNFITMDSSASENFYGYIVASYSLGQMIASPIVGYLSNRLKKIRHLLYIGIFLAFLGNALYLCVHLFPIEERKYALLIGRFVTGIGSSNISLLKAYASSASTQRDRSRAIALVTGGVALGMTMGPAFQLLFTPIGYPGPNIFISGLMLSMYTAPALMACIMNAVNAFCIFTYFREVYAGVMSSRSQINRNEPALPKIDKRALFLCYFTRFTQMFINTNLETLGASLAMVLFAWTRTESVKYFSAAQAIMSLLAFLIYVGFIMFRFDRFLHERCNVITSLFALLLFHILTYSYPFLPGHLTTYSSEDYPFNSTDIDDDGSNEEIQHVGCDTSKFSWCNSVRSINPFYFYICYILFIGLAFPSLNVSLNTLFSKIIGPRRQGFQQGLLQMAGGAARMVGPVVIRYFFWIKNFFKFR